MLFTNAIALNNPTDISDHRPVAISFNYNINDIGDMNADGSLNILDIVILANNILSGEK